MVPFYHEMSPIHLKADDFPQELAQLRTPQHIRMFEIKTANAVPRVCLLLEAWHHRHHFTQECKEVLLSKAFRTYPVSPNIRQGLVLIFLLQKMPVLACIAAYLN